MWERTSHFRISDPLSPSLVDSSAQNTGHAGLFREGCAAQEEHACLSMSIALSYIPNTQFKKISFCWGWNFSHCRSLGKWAVGKQVWPGSLDLICLNQNIPFCDLRGQPPDELWPILSDILAGQENIIRKTKKSAIDPGKQVRDVGLRTSVAVLHWARRRWQVRPR